MHSAALKCSTTRLARTPGSGEAEPLGERRSASSSSGISPNLAAPCDDCTPGPCRVALVPGTWIFLVGGCLLGAHSPAPLQRQVEGRPAEFADRGAGRALGVGPLLGREPRSGARG